MSKKRKKKNLLSLVPENDPKKPSNHCPRWFHQQYLAVFAVLGVLVTVNYRQISFFMQATMSDAKMDLGDMLQRVSKASHLFELAADRKLLATNDIPINTLLLEIPREMMIWDLDAVRHSFIQKELLEARFVGIDSATRRAALLSAYMALLRNKVISPIFEAHVSVVNAIPSYEEYASFHPVLVESSELDDHLGGAYSPGYQQVVSTRNQIFAEYNEFTQISEKFRSQVSKEDYVAFRIAVQSRAFHVPKIRESEALQPNFQSEKEYYRQKLQIDFDDFAVAIMPVHDWMNAHATNNVKVQDYDPVSRTCRASSIQPISKGGELINNYGELLDMTLFSQYGYVPSDGSGVTFARLYPYHDIAFTDFQPKIEPSQEEMLPYLHLDFGYSECIQKDKDPKAAELKVVKSIYLQKIANDIERWYVPLPSRTKRKKSPFSTTVLLDNYMVPSFNTEINNFLSSAALRASLPCRLITLTHRDLDGQGLATLKDDLDQMNRESSSDILLKLEEAHIDIAWMARTLHCMRILASAQKHKYGITVGDQSKKIIEMANSNSSVSSLEWNAAHVKLGELQSQEVLENFTTEFLKGIKMDDITDDFYVRTEPCPKEYSDELL